MSSGQNTGRTERGFDWLGVWFDATGPTGIAPRAKENHRARRLRLEEQARWKGLSEKTVRLRVQQYEARWALWAERQIRDSLCRKIKFIEEFMLKIFMTILLTMLGSCTVFIGASHKQNHGGYTQ
jgi:hypothetical protein